MGSVTAARPAETYEIAAIRALQECSQLSLAEWSGDTVYPLLALSVLAETGSLQGREVRLHVTQIAHAIPSSDSAANFLITAAKGFARCTDTESAAELAEAAGLRRLTGARS